MLSFIGNQFKRPSGFGGKIISFLMKKGNRHAYDKMIPYLNIKSGDRILEIGYGHGVGIDKICSGYDCFVTGIDFSELMFKEAQKRNQQHINNNKLDLHFGDYMDFKVPGEQFDKIFFINVIYFWDRLEEPFRKIYGELKQNGQLLIYMAHRDDINRLKFTKDHIFNKYTIDVVTDKLSIAGFKDIKHQFDNGYFIECRK